MYYIHVHVGERNEFVCFWLVLKCMYNFIIGYPITLFCFAWEWRTVHELCCTSMFRYQWLGFFFFSLNVQKISTSTCKLDLLLRWCERTHVMAQATLTNLFRDGQLSDSHTSLVLVSKNIETHQHKILSRWLHIFLLENVGWDDKGWPERGERR